MTLESSKSFVLTVIKQWQNPLLALTTPMGTLLHQRQYGIVVLTMPHWIADGTLIDAVAHGIKNVAKRPAAIIPGTMFQPALSRPRTFQNIKKYAAEHHIIIIVGYPRPVEVAPTQEFAKEADYVICARPRFGTEVEVYFGKINPCTQGTLRLFVKVNTDQLTTPLDWSAREMGATVMTRTSRLLEHH